MKKLILIITLAVYSFTAHAQALSSVVPINAIVTNAAGVGVSGTVNGAVLTASNAATFTAAGGASMSVPVTASATVSRLAIAGNMVKLARAAGPIGLAISTWAVYQAYKDSGYKTCPPPDFFCKPDVVISDGYRWRVNQVAIERDTRTQACTDALAIYGYTYSYYSGSATYGSCYATNGFSLLVYQIGTCAGGTAPPCVATTVPGGVYSDAELSQAFQDYMQSHPDFAVRYYNAIRADNAKQKVLTDSDIVPASSPVTITAPPVTSPQVVTSRQIASCRYHPGACLNCSFFHGTFFRLLNLAGCFLKFGITTGSCGRFGNMILRHVVSITGL